MVDNLVRGLENFRALMKFTGKHFSGDRQAQDTVLRKELCKNYDSFGPELLPKFANDADQTDLEK